MNKKNVFIVVALFFIISFFFNLSFGGSGINIKDILTYVFNRDQINDLDRFETILFDIRLPRTVVAMMAGACLSASGVLIQAVMKNPLADSGILGIQSGATLVALLIMLVYPALAPIMPIAAFLGGFAVYLLLMSTAFKSGFSPIKLVLTGVAINALIGAVIGMVTIYNSEKIQNALAWLNGSFASVDTSDMYLMIIYGSLALIASLLLIKKCNLLLLDDATIITIGENLMQTRFIVASLSVLLASISVSIVGIIGFIGLVVPHIGRMIVGSRHEYLLPFSITIGASLTMFADGFQKWFFNPVEIPAGTIISFIGASFFFYLLIREQKYD
ncbi:FecCD family ABC transporter permease [Mycoplasma sp. P36-A1]|uniref:FecCD family ABC transporter permease n=1 Tax=Mycoplasma sp. P36-A1 TaxID=3252900 RepID=UPI003C2CD1C7